MSLRSLVPSHPPNKTACVGLMQVTVKPDLGEGLLPVIKGEDHVPNKNSNVIFIGK